MSEHPPLDKNIDNTPKFAKERVATEAKKDLILDEQLAHYIHNETEGKGVSTEHIHELIDVANEKIAARHTEITADDEPIATGKRMPNNKDTEELAHYVHNETSGKGASTEHINEVIDLAAEKIVARHDKHNSDIQESEQDSGEKLDEKQEREDEAREQVEDVFEETEDDQNSQEVDKNELPTEPDEADQSATEPKKIEQAELQQMIDEADNIQWPPERARQLRALAEQHNSLEAARKITRISGSKNKNPLRFMRWLTGTDRSAHDRAMKDIVKSSTAHNEDRLIAAQAIIRGNGRNEVLAGVLTEMMKEKPKTALAISREMRGPSRSKYRNQIVSQYAKSLGNEQLGLAVIKDELRLDGPLSRHLKNKLSDEQVNRLSKILDKLPSAKRDKAIQKLAVQHNSLGLVKEIKSASLRREVRKELNKK
ncbi:MAG: hypothetical protein Q7T74_07575 [Candidatus Saccharibacteria bacterium]|nr:hypothetical protein [Candidatus Saccharibacteria bacterium]